MNTDNSTKTIYIKADDKPLIERMTEEAYQKRLSFSEWIMSIVRKHYNGGNNS